MRQFFQLVSRHPSAALLFLQLASLLIYPLLIDSTAGGALLTVVGTLAVLLAVWIVNRSPAVNCSWALAFRHRPDTGGESLWLSSADALGAHWKHCCTSIRRMA
jgi:hypothetical protein